MVFFSLPQPSLLDFITHIIQLDIKADNEQRQRNPTTPQPTSGGSQATPSRSIASSSVNNEYVITT